MTRSALALMIAAVLLLPAAARANVAVPSMFAFMAPGWIAVATAGLSFVVIAGIEAVVLKRLLELNWMRSIRYSLVINVVSSICGILFGCNAWFLILLVAAVPLSGHLRRKCGCDKWSAMMLAVVPALLTIPWAILTFDAGLRPWAFWGALIPAFLLSVVVELIALQYMHGGKLRPKILFAANAASYVVLLGFLLLMRYSTTNNPMLWSEYLGMRAVHEAKQGNLAGAMGFLDALGERFDESLAAKDTLESAKHLARHGHLAEARRLVEFVKERESDWPDWIDVPSEIASTEGLIAREEARQAAQPAP